MKNDDSTCARCGQPFHCGASDAEPCWCCSVTLDAATLAELSARYRGCLCRDCLLQLMPPSPGQDASS